jgi:hypothetical protein
MWKTLSLRRQDYVGPWTEIYHLRDAVSHDFIPSGQTLLSRTASVNHKAGSIPLARVGKMNTTTSSNNLPKSGNIALIFFGQESFSKFGEALLSPSFHDHWDQSWLKKSKPDLRDPIELQNQMIEIFGLDLFKGSVYTLSCEVVSRVEHIADISSLQNSTAVFVFGSLDEKNQDALDAIQTKSEASLIMDFTSTEGKKGPSFSFKEQTEETLLLVDFIIYGDIYTTADSFEENYREVTKKASATALPLLLSPEHICQSIDRLHKEHKKQVNAFDRREQPRVYVRSNTPRVNFTSWLGSLKEDLAQLIDCSVVVQNSFRRLAAYWKQRDTKKGFEIETDNDRQRLELNLEDFYETIEDAVKDLKIKYVHDKADQAQNRFHGMLKEFNNCKKIEEFTKFNDWSPEEKKTLSFNYNPLFWESMFDLHSLNLATSKYDVPDNANTKLKFWIKPTEVDDINRRNLDHRIRRSFLNHAKKGGMLS